jgi:hypothetical protein
MPKTLPVVPTGLQTAGAEYNSGANNGSAPAANRPRGLIQILMQDNASNPGRGLMQGGSVTNPSTQPPVPQSERGLLQSKSTPAAPAPPTNATPGRGLLQTPAANSDKSAQRGILQAQGQAPASTTSPASFPSGYDPPASEAPVTNSIVPVSTRGILQPAVTPAYPTTVPSGYTPPAGADPGVIPTGQRGLFDIFLRRVHSGSTNNTQ